VALWGVSMGGWLAGLTVCCDARLSAVVLTVPTVRSNPSYADRILKRGVREAWRTCVRRKKTWTRRDLIRPPRNQ
jgi:alpha-beta hydrolase superfamily lysophospholipase